MVLLTYKLTRHKPLVVLGGNLALSVDHKTYGFVEVECIFSKPIHFNGAVADKLRRRKPLVLLGGNLSQSVEQRTCGFVEVESSFVAIPLDQCSRLQTQKAQGVCRIRWKFVPVCRSENTWFCGGRMHFFAIPFDQCSLLQTHTAQAACRIRWKLVPVCRSESVYFLWR